jgi:hypothetical protein
MILTVALRLKTYLHLDLSLPPESERDTVIGEYLSPSSSLGVSIDLKNR